jgi:acyl-CoA synthetase (AMP-forming)/AMP-acid ligase II
MPLSVVQKAMRLLPHVDFVNAYGLTETSSTIAILSPDDHRTASSSSDEMVAKRLGSVGKPLPHLELQVRDHQGNVQPPGSPGEVFVRGEQISGEYVGHKTVRDDGWFPTKDMGWLDADGYLFIEGRLDDVIVRGGENISPGEIEDVLRSHADVADAAVFGSPDDQWGERIVAVVVRRGTVSESVLKDLVRQQLRSTKTPDAVHFSDSLPYNETGKLLRRELRKQYR